MSNVVASAKLISLKVGLSNFVLSHELYRINMHLQERYFENFNSERDKEIDG